MSVSMSRKDENMAVKDLLFANLSLCAIISAYIWKSQIIDSNLSTSIHFCDEFPHLWALYIL